MEAMLGISMYSCTYVKVAKALCLSYNWLCLLFNKTGEEGRTGSAWKRGGWGGKERGGEEGEGQGGEIAQTMYAHMNKF
jgi:hypothetical protein